MEQEYSVFLKMQL